MEEIVGIICEYNPFHKGHKYQIDALKARMPNCKIVAIMSGNAVQRGELSMIEKYDRAELALRAGVDAVFELPYPYSSSTAEIFAGAGVKIATRLGCTHLCFGTESEDISHLENIANELNIDTLKGEIYNEISISKCSYARAKEKILKKKGYNLPKSSNDMLALEYIRAIKSENLPLKYMNIARQGADYNDEGECEIMSATAIRKSFQNNGKFVSIPEDVADFYEKIAKEGKFCDLTSYYDFIHKFALITDRDIFEKAFDSCEEIGAIIKEKAKLAKNGESFVSSLSSKAYTKSRIKRVLLYAFFGITSFDKAPNFTILLGANDNGRKISKNAKINLITKVKDSKKLEGVSLKLYEKTLLLDQVYATFLKTKIEPIEAFNKKPKI